MLVKVGIVKLRLNINDQVFRNKEQKITDRISRLNKTKLLIFI